MICTATRRPCPGVEERFKTTMATKTAAKPKTKKTASKTAQKPAARKTAAKKAPAAKTASQKATTPKAAAKKAAPQKMAAKKTATARKAAPKTAVKTAAKKAAPKKPAAKKKAAAPAEKPAKPAAKKAAPAASRKAAPKKAAAPAKAASKADAGAGAKPGTRNAAKAPVKTAAKAVKKPSAKSVAPAAEPPAEEASCDDAPKKRANVGQAPRKTTFAASIPVPSQSPPREAPEADELPAAAAKDSSSAKLDFKVNDQIVYPAHGVGQIVGLEKQEVAGIAIELFVIDFDQEKMKLRVPTGKAKAAGMRPLSSDKAIKDAISTLKGRARVKRTMWSRRAQEYDAKINSGDIKLVAEVVRDLYRADDQPEQSYSERQLFEAALDRMAREVAAVRKADLGVAIEELEGCLRKKSAA